MADIELSALRRQGLDRHLPDPETLRDEMAAWAERRTAQAVRVNWRFPPADARIRLKRLSPSMQT
jgi:hypothetical protein